MILQVDGLSFRYNSHPALQGVKFSVAEGELLAILGPNGVGKTTLLKCINRILKPAGGMVRLRGRDMLGLNAAEVARDVGYVAQKNESARLTVYDAVLLGRRPHIRWRAEKSDLAMVDAVLHRLNLQALALRYIDQLSGGQLQQVAVARALVQEPSLLLLDEPTSSLDLKNQVTILQLIRRIVDEHRIAAIMTMHDLNTALRFADSFLFLKNNTIHAVGRCHEVSATLVEEIYGLPVAMHQIHGSPVFIPLLDNQGEEPCHAHIHPNN